MADVEARQFQEGWDMNANRDEQDSGGVVQEWAGWFRDCPALTPFRGFPRPMVSYHRPVPRFGKPICYSGLVE